MPFESADCKLSFEYGHALNSCNFSYKNGGTLQVKWSIPSSFNRLELVSFTVGCKQIYTILQYWYHANTPLLVEHNGNFYGMMITIATIQPVRRLLI